QRFEPGHHFEKRIKGTSALRKARAQGERRELTIGLEENCPMGVQTSEAQRQATPAEASKLTKPVEPRKPAWSRVPAIIVGVVIAAIAGLSIWYLVRPVPLLVQGEVDATRL